jgi:hypothetical protein
MQIEAGFQVQILLSAHVIRLRFQGKRAQQPRARARVQSAQVAWALKPVSRIGDAGLGPCRRPERPPGSPAALAPRARLRWKRRLHWPHAVRAPSWGGRALSRAQASGGLRTRRAPGAGGNSNYPMQAPAGGHHDSDLGAGAVKEHGPTCQRAFGAACGAVTFELNGHRGLQRPSSCAFVTGCI